MSTCGMGMGMGTGRPAEAPRPPAGWGDFRRTPKAGQDWVEQEGVREAGEPMITGVARPGTAPLSAQLSSVQLSPAARPENEA